MDKVFVINDFIESFIGFVDFISGNENTYTQIEKLIKFLCYFSYLIYCIYKEYKLLENFRYIECDDEECSICTGTETGAMYLTPCKHTFHRDCLNNWRRINNNCPNCRHCFRQ